MTQANLDLQSILSTTLDDLADIPAFAIYPAGVHRCTIKSFEPKEIATKAGKTIAVELKLSHNETVEQADPTETPATPNQEVNQLFMLDNEFGQGALKEILKPLAVAFGGNNMGEVMAASVGAEVVVVTNVRKDKTDPDKKYFGIKKLIVE